MHQVMKTISRTAPFNKKIQTTVQTAWTIIKIHCLIIKKLK